MAFQAQDRGTGVASVEVLVDDSVRERFEGDDCAPGCSTIAGDWFFDTDTVSEGTHRIEVIARDNSANATRRSFTVNVPGPNHYAAALSGWRTSVQQQVDEASAADLTGPMPVPPDSWNHASDCDATTDALRACYDAIMDWGADVQNWLTANLPDATAAGSLPNPPTFEYSPEEDTPRDLTRRIRDAFTVARHNVADPNGTLDVAIGFHRPLTPSEVSAAVPAGAALQDQSALTGVYDPVAASWGGSVRVSTPASLDTSIEDFYVKESELAAGNISELEQETPADDEEAEDIAAALQDARAFKTHLDARGSFITGVTVRLGPSQAASAMRSAVAGQGATNIKTMTPLSSPATSDAGATALSAMSVDAATVSTAARATSSTLTEPREPTCEDRGEVGRVPESIVAPNPVYAAPSRHKADTVLGDPDGGHHLKVHRLRFRWQAAYGLAWMCADRSGDRNVELEAQVYPELPRWSDNWETNNARKYTQTNMPGNIHQDDLASGYPPNPFDKAKYPDFAIIAQASRQFRYRKLYFVNFTTNEGEDDQGRVIYSMQPTARAWTAAQQGYCGARFSDYKSCMFSAVDVCYNHAYISEAPVYRRVDWSAHLGYRSRLTDVARLHPEQVDGRKIITYCDARPPGSEDT
ncbi:MAG TPA: hypothetical protein VK501_22650 [Baekduia sp.]|uniref:hypothetical protein n=1 Tax=Baekduia sp. TaxID=2600305 RepID=UPI002C28A677|nr:hypothetical protein [Baekduia sp.]HMJ36723.1 hypothetical protein [Baekduia sp.]